MKWGQGRPLFSTEEEAGEGGIFKVISSRVWWDVPVVTTLGRQKPEDLEFKVVLGYRARLRPA